MTAPLNEDVNELANQKGRELYARLMADYPEPTIRDFDLRMNIPFMALCLMIWQHTSKENRSVLARAMADRLVKNMERTE